jgi:hypothetical protein
VCRESCLLIPVAARSKAWTYDHSLAEIAGSNIGEGHGKSLVNVLCCQVSATDRTPSQKSSTDCGVLLSVTSHNHNPLHLQ